MTWGVTTSNPEKQQAKAISGQVPDFQLGAVKKVEVEPTMMLASKKAYICAGMMLICGLLTIIGGICQEFALYNMSGKFHGWSIWTGVLFTIAGTCAVLACNKQSKPRMISATVFSILTIITALVVIILFGFCVAKGVKMHRRMTERKERQWREEFGEHFDKFGWRRHFKEGDSDESGEHWRPHGGKPPLHGKPQPEHHHRRPCKTKRPGPRPTRSLNPRPTPTWHPWYWTPRRWDSGRFTPTGHPWPTPTGRPWPSPTPRGYPRYWTTKRWDTGRRTPTGHPWPTPTGRPWPSPTPRGYPRYWTTKRWDTGRRTPTGHHWPTPRGLPWPSPTPTGYPRYWTTKRWDTGRRTATGHPWPNPTGRPWKKSNGRPWPKPNGRIRPSHRPWLGGKDGKRNNDYSKFTHGWPPMMLFVASLFVVTLVLIELVNAVLLTIFSVRSLKAAKYVLMHETVVVNVPADDKKVLANIDDLPKI
ncbi:uncharacterized protein LOC135489115 [Lineus longissimus]|uniref:uncharacterized protein LOC135489115 n=1 Tax=Lineus longissimus TaxID=88925 RepID=UPI002B4CA21B